MDSPGYFRRKYNMTATTANRPTTFQEAMAAAAQDPWDNMEYIGLNIGWDGRESRKTIPVNGTGHENPGVDVGNQKY
jgi:hypothetical protein